MSSSPRLLGRILNLHPSASDATRVRQACAYLDLGNADHTHELAPGVWQVTTPEQNLVVKLFFGPSAQDRLQLEVISCQQLSRMGAPVPANSRPVIAELAIVRDWIPGKSLHHLLSSIDGATPTHGATILRAWRDLTRALNQFYLRISSGRRTHARTLRTHEVRCVVEAVSESFPRIVTEDLAQLHKIVVDGDLSILPLDASPTNLILGTSHASFIDLEILGIDFEDWTLAKFLTATTPQNSSTMPSSLLNTAPGLTSARPRLEAAAALLLLAAGAGLWTNPVISPTTLATVFPDNSDLTRRISASLV